ncbi:Glycoside hydrolase 2 (Mannanase, beta-galactosidase), partial [Ceratobasidium sp. 392]
MASNNSPPLDRKPELDSPDNESLRESHDVNDRALLRKIDWHLLPILTLLYLLSFLDRANIGNAKLDGLTTDIHVAGAHYNTALALYFVGYVLWEVPANIVLKKFNPKVWLPTLTLAWGIVSTCQGFITNRAGLELWGPRFAIRFFLGTAEAGLFPGVIYVFSVYYRRRERHWRVAVFFGGAAVSGAFGGILAWAISKMRGVGGKPGWAWIFILEGLLTIIVAVISYWIVPDWPERAAFLTPEERARLIERSKYDSAGVTEAFKWKYVVQALGDHLVWGYALLFHGFAFVLYSLSLFLPTIIAGLGYASWEAQLLTVPPYALSAISIGVTVWLASVYNRRAIFIAGAAVIAIIGYILLLATNSAGRQYVGVHFACAGVYTGNALLLSWPGENVASQTKRAVAVAMQISIGDLGVLDSVAVSNFGPALDFDRLREPSMEDKPHKAHHPSQSGNKVEKKTKGKGKADHGKGYNEKAFAPKSGRNADRQGRRAAEKDQTRLHVPLVNRTPEEEPPPVIVAIVGPPGVGKSTLVKSLVKRYTKHTLSEVKGPITVVAGKKRRLTFVECNNDLNSMIDIGKIADLVLLMIDGSFGFEMETFEFLNILQSHGFPKVIGVLTHLDLIKKLSTQRDTKKQLKKRFWAEIYQGAKLFYLSGVLNGRYPDTEIQNLSRFISVMKFRPLVFRNSHPYLLADRIQDMTPRELVRQQPAVDRTVTLYGYLRGTNLRETTKVHVPGAGDLVIKSVTRLADPCPLPTADSEKRRKLSEKQKLIHAPMSDVGGVMYDKDAVYINVPGSFTRKGENGEENVPQGEGERMVMDLQDVTHTLAEKLSQSHIRLLGTSKASLQVEKPTPDAESDEDGDESGEDEDDSDTDLDDSDTESEAGSVASGSGLGNRGRTAPRQPRFPSGPSGARSKTSGDVEYAESDSDLGDERLGGAMGQSDEEDLDLEDNSEGEEWEDEEHGEGDEDAPRWKSNLSARASQSFSQNSRRRRDWTKLVYGSDLTAHQVVFGKTASADTPEDAEDEDELFTIKRPAGP